MAVAAVLGLYAVFLGLGLRAARRARGRSVAELLVAGRAMPLWLATLTMTATWVDGGYLLGTVEGTYKSSVALGLQGGVCFGISLVLGGLFFARRMRELEFTTLIDPFESRFGARWAAVLMLPALAAELFWSAELLVALGSTLGVMAGVGLAAAILVSAAVVTAYTVAGGIWSVAYTDALQLALVALGMLVAIPVVAEAVGGLSAAWAGYAASRTGGAGLLPPFSPVGAWTLPSITAWWDVSAMLVLGGIPWNCYFQRVLSCRTPSAARWHSILSGLLTVAFTVPPLLIGVAATQYAWPPEVAAALQARPAETLPAVFRYLTPGWIAVLGLGAIIGAVTSSFSASILSAGSMVAWNCCSRFLRPAPGPVGMRRLVRLAVVLLGGAAAVLALEVQSVQALWFFTSDLVFVLLFPQLVAALFDPRVNRVGSMAAFSMALVLRMGGGEPLFGIPPLVRYPDLLAPLLPGGPSAWYDPVTGAILLPFKTAAAVAGMVTLPIVSRLTARWDPPRALRNPRASE
jgi:high affinity choline transporter 7